MPELFRREAIEFRRTRLLGVVTVDKAPLLNYMVLAVVAASMSLLLVAATANYARVEIVPGVVVTAEPANKVFPPRNGVIEKIFVRERDAVSAGQTVAIVSLDSQSADGELFAASSLRALDRQIAALNAQRNLLSTILSQERDRLSAALIKNGEESDNLVEQSSIQAQVLSSSKSLIESLEPLVAAGWASKVELERRRQALLIEKQKALQIEQQKTQNQAQRYQLQGQLANLETDTEKQMSEVAVEIDNVRQQQARLKTDVSYAVVAPIDGHVTSLRMTVGMHVDSRIPLFATIPVNATYEAQLFAPSRAMGFIQEGQAIRLMYDGFPYRRFGSFPGRITEVAHSIISVSELDVPLKLEEAAYPVRVALEQQHIDVPGGTASLRAGMTL